MQITLRDKTKHLPLRKGFSRRINFLGSYGIVVHSTNGKIGNSFENEVMFLYNSTLVSAHYIIGKDGTIVQLVPIEYCAWHAGEVFSNMTQYANNNSIGIELHYAIGEDKNLPKQRDALVSLCKNLLDNYHIVGIKTHREVAAPLGRKVDPSNYTDQEFEQLRESIFQDKSYYTVKAGSKLYTAPEDNSKIATHINNDFIQRGLVTFDHSFSGKVVQNGYIWVTSGIGFFRAEDTI